jgi:formate hydrogenlyase subunit 6/NADH:ubiquinone oxidoreductase subunit I
MHQFMKDIYDGMKTFMVGMKVTGSYLKDSNLREKETVTTIDYDGSMTMAKDVKVSDRFRGHLHNDVDKCIMCDACTKACPIDCFWLDAEKTETNKLRGSRFDIDLLKCMYCGLCVFACPTGSLTMTKEWWGSTFAGEGGDNLHGQIRRFGVGYYTPEQKVDVERKRLEALEARKKAAAAAVAAKAAAEAKRKAEEAAKAAGNVPNVIVSPSSGVLSAVDGPPDGKTAI